MSARTAADEQGVRLALADSLHWPLTGIDLEDDWLWLRVWQMRIGGARPAFYFPFLPMSLTGLKVDVTLANISDVLPPAVATLDEMRLDEMG